MFQAQTASENHVWVHGLVASEVCGDIHGLCYHGDNWNHAVVSLPCVSLTLKWLLLPFTGTAAGKMALPFIGEIVATLRIYGPTDIIGMHLTWEAY